MTTNCGLNTAESNRIVLRFQKEDPNCYGNLKTSGTRVTKVARVKSADVNVNKETQVSEEIRADRQVSGTYALNASSESSFDYEMARGTIDDFIAAYLGLEDWTKSMSMSIVRGDNVSFTANNTLEVVGKDLTPYFQANDVVKTEGFIDPANNNYWTISAVSFASGKTTFTFVETTAVVEAGNAYSTIMDANDVLVMGTDIKADNNGFYSSSPIFQTLRANGKLEPGRYIHVSGLGLEEGSLALTGQPNNGEVLTISDGNKSINFEFVTIGNAPQPGNTGVEIGSTANDTANNLQKAIMQALNERRLLCSAKVTSSGGTETVTIRNLRREGGGAISGTITNGSITNFSGSKPEVSGYFKILSATDTRIDVSPSPVTENNASSLRVVIKGSHAAPPSKASDIKKLAFWLERGHEDINQFFLVKGQRVETIEMNISSGDLVSGNVNFVGSELNVLTETELGKPIYTQQDALTTPVFNATSNVKEVRRDGQTLPGVIMSVKLTMSTDLRKQFSVGSYYNKGVGQGRLDITGEMEVYFQNQEWYNRFLQNQYVNLEMFMEDADNCGYVISLPKIFLTKDEVPSGGIDEDVMENISFTANLDDSLSKASVVFSRFSSTLPYTA